MHKFDVIDFVRLLGVVVRMEMGKRSEKHTREAVFNSQSNVFGQISCGFWGKNGKFLAKKRKNVDNIVSFAKIEVCANMKADRRPERGIPSFLSIRESCVLEKLAQYKRGVEI